MTRHLITDELSLETPVCSRPGDVVSGSGSDGRSPPSWLPKALAVAAVVALVVYLGLFWTPPELGGTSDRDPESSTETDDGTTTVPVPPVQFDFDYVGDDRQVTVRHVGGGLIDGQNTDELYLTVDGERRRTWSRPVSAGDSVAVDAGPDQRVSVIWTAPGGGESAVLADFRTPEASGPTTTPQAAFGFEYSDEGVTVQHEGGDVFSEENTGDLYLTVDGERRATWSLSVTAGDEVTVDAGPGQRVAVVWTPPDAGGRAQVVGAFETPDETPSSRGPFEFREQSIPRVTISYTGPQRITSADTQRVVVTASAGVKRAWDLPIEPGDSIAVNATDGSVIRVTQRSSDGSRDVLATYEVGADRSERIVVPNRLARPQEP